MTLKPLIDSNLSNLKILDVSYNGIRKLLLEIIEFLPKLEKMFVSKIYFNFRFKSDQDD